MLLWLSAGLVLMPKTVPAQPRERPDNFTVFQNLFDGLAARLVQQLPGDPPMPCVLPYTAEATSAAGLLRARTARHLLERGGAVFAADSSAATQSYLRIGQHLLRCQLQYERVRDSRRWRRLAVVEVEVEVVEQPSGQILLQDFYRGEFADTLRASEIRPLETAGFPFTIGRWPPRSVWTQMVEPLLLTATAGAVMYALYALRTQ